MDNVKEIKGISDNNNSFKILSDKTSSYNTNIVSIKNNQYNLNIMEKLPINSNLNKKITFGEVKESFSLDRYQYRFHHLLDSYDLPKQ